jgi:flagellar biosynthesis protein FliP
MTRHTTLVFMALAVAFLVLPALSAHAQSFTLDLGDTDAAASGTTTLSQRVVQIFALVTVLSLVPGIAMMATCFPFMVTVLAILRMGIGLQQSPPNMLLVALAVFLTWFVMEPVFAAAWADGVVPYNNGTMSLEAAARAVAEPFRVFMAARVDPGTMAELQTLRPDAAEGGLSTLIPAFMLSEIQRAFEVGFLIFLPFLIIDLVVAAILMSMGMMMVPPVAVSLPFKLAFFVVADGWSLVAGALVRNYV